MILAAPELLAGAARALIEPLPEEAGGGFAEGRRAVAALLCLLLAQEVETAAKTRLEENRALRQLFLEAFEGGWAPELAGRLREAARGEDQNLSLTSLDLANADLKRLVIGLQSAVEAAPGAAGRARQRRIMRVLLEGARARRLSLPVMGA